jgi:hypothetical protein
LAAAEVHLEAGATAGARQAAHLAAVVAGDLAHQR